MKIEILDKGRKPTEWVKFVLSGVDVSFANAMRQAIMTEAPVLAIEDVSIRQNSSALYDELLALRLGLVPIRTDDSFILRTEASGEAQYSVSFSLKAKGPKWVYSGQLECSDRRVKPAFDDIPLVYLDGGQELDLDAVAVTGKGSEHIKWQAAFAFFQNYPKMIMKGKEIEFNDGFASKDLVVAKDGKIKDIKNWNLGLARRQMAGGAEISEEKGSFIFYVESFGQMELPMLLSRAGEQVAKKFEAFSKSFEELK